MPTPRRCPIGWDTESYYDVQDWDGWVRNRDRLEQLGATAVRLGNVPWHSDDAQLDFMVRVLKDCKARDWFVSYTLAQLNNNGSQTMAEIPATIRPYVAKVAAKVAPYVDAIQVLNEHDATSFVDYATSLGSVYDPATQTSRVRPGMTPEYLAGLRDVIAAARDEIHKVNPNVLVGTSTTGVQMDESCESCIWYPFFDVVGPVCDFIGINGYPMKWYDPYYRDMSRRLRNVSLRYDRKPVILTEIGLPTNGSQGTGRAMEQAMRLVATMVDHASRSEVVAAVLGYQLVDRAHDPDDAESCFGIYHHDDAPQAGALKVGGGAVIATVHSLTDRLPTQQEDQTAWL